MKLPAYLLPFLLLAPLAAAPQAQAPAKSATVAAAAAAAAPKISAAERADIQALLAANSAVQVMQASTQRAMRFSLLLLRGDLPPGPYKERLLRLFTQELSAEVRPVEA